MDNTVDKYIYVLCNQIASVQVLALILANCVTCGTFYTFLNFCFLFEKMEIIVPHPVAIRVNWNNRSRVFTSIWCLVSIQRLVLVTNFVFSVFVLAAGVLSIKICAWVFIITIRKKIVRKHSSKWTMYW